MSPTEFQFTLALRSETRLIAANIFQSKGLFLLKPGISILMATLFVATGALVDNAKASADDLPQFDSALFCQDLTSKMLVKSERLRETLGCMYWEGISKGQIQQHWNLISPAALKQCMKYRTTITSRSYTYFQGCIADVIGMECLRGHIKCE